MNGRKIQAQTDSGWTANMMMVSDRCKARIFGTCSPRVMWKNVMPTIARTEAIACAVNAGPPPLISPGTTSANRAKARSRTGWRFPRTFARRASPGSGWPWSRRAVSPR